MGGPAALLVLALVGGPAVPQNETLASIQVHGNQLTSDEEIVAAAAIQLGDPFHAEMLAEVAQRLRQTGRFEHVEVLKRFASIDDMSRIALVIVVHEGPVRVEVPDDPDLPLRIVRRRGLTRVLFMPILAGEDGYGLTYGGRATYVGVMGRRGRVSVPLTWGGEKRVGVEFDRPFTSGPFTRVAGGAALQRVRNPGFDVDDTRRRLWARAERTVGVLRLGGVAEWQRVSFAGTDDEVRSGGVDVQVDTRRDPQFPRNAVIATASWTRLDFASGRAIDRRRYEARGYLGLAGQTVLEARVLREDASRALPPAFQSLLGGSSNLRGFRAGSAAGDTLVSGSLELKVPLSSPLNIGQIGVNTFIDSGAVYAAGGRLRDQTMRTGFGAGVWMTATVFHAGVAIARGRHAGTRVHFGAGISY
jgi:outer membrane protein assembly factor BamA